MRTSNHTIPSQPVLYEINTAVFLHELSIEYGQPITLQNVPSEVWQAIAARGFDAVWFMGVWQRSPLAQEMAHNDPSLPAALPDITEQDILGSAYSIYRYEVDEHFGGRAGLAAARRRLRHHGLGIILDFVPNHVSLDHHWTHENAEHFVRGTYSDLHADPEAFYKTPVGVIAKGKDPNFPPWSDVAQLNAFSAHNRLAAAHTLIDIASQCDGVRCDMAMLMLNDIFALTWGERAGTVPDTDYWQTVITAVRAKAPRFCFIAEVYWDLHSVLFEQGFDICYDKDFYDVLARKSAKEIVAHIRHTAPYQTKLLRFTENHDEARAVTHLSTAQSFAAAVIMATLPTARLFHQGQFEGRRVRIPVHLGRGPNEEPSQASMAFYQVLLDVLAHMRVRGGIWKMAEVTTRRFGRASSRILAWTWQTPAGQFAVIVNYSPRGAHGIIHVPWQHGAAVQLFKNTGTLQRKAIAIKRGRLPMSLRAWGFAIYRITS